MNALDALDARQAFNTSGRFELLAADHVPFTEMGASDADGRLRDAILAGDGVACVLGVPGSGKSSLIGSVSELLPARYVPLRIPVAAATDAISTIGGFSRHALERFTQLDLKPLTKRHERAIERALATERTTAKRRGLRVSSLFTAGPPGLNARLGADFQLQASEELKFAATDQAALQALQQALDVLGGAGLAPVLIIEDTDHWAATPDVASRFFDQVVRALSKGTPLDAVTVVAVQPVHQRSDGYRGVRQNLVLELDVPGLPDPRAGLEVLLSARIHRADIAAKATDVFTEEGLGLLGKAYGEDKSFRRVLSVARAALQQALSDGADAIEAGHVQHGMAQYPSAVQGSG